MARIPIVNQQVGGPGVADLVAPRPNQALGQLAQSADRVDNVLDALADREAAINGAKALADFRIARTERQTKLRTEAQDPAGFSDLTAKDFDEASQKLLQAHDNPRVQAYLEGRLIDARTSEVADAVVWEAGERVRRTEVNAVETVNKYANMVNSNPGQFASALDDVDAMFAASGLPAASSDKLRAGARAQLAQSAVYGQLERNPAGVLRDLNAGTWDAYLDPDNKIAAVNAAQAEIKRREAEAKANAAQARAEIAQDAADLAKSDLLSRQLAGKGVTDPKAAEVIKAGLTPKQYERYQSAAARADTVFKTVGDMRSMTPAEMQATVEKAKPAGGEVDFADRQAAYTEAQQMAASVMQARRADPALAAREAFSSVRDRWAFYESKPNKEHLRDAIKATLAAQEAMGVSANQRAPMPHQMAIAIAGGIKAAKPEIAAAELQKAASEFGSYWPQAFRQMSKHLDGNAKVAAIIPDLKEAALLIEGSRQPVEALRKANGVKTNDISDTVANDDRVRNLAVSLSQRAGGSGTAIQVAKSVEVLALSRMRAYGEDQNTATEHAIQKVVGDRYAFGSAGSRPFRVPRQAGDVDAIETGARGLQTTLKLDDVDLPAAPAGLVTDEVRKSYVDAVRRNGYWVTDDNESGLILYNERGVPVTRNGQPIRATWSELQRAEDKAPWRAFEAFR